MNFRSTILAVAAAAATLATTGLAVAPAAAQTIESVAVSYADLNLDTQSGRAALDGRIAFAARKLCGNYSSVELKWAHQSRMCQADVIASAEAQLAAIDQGERYAALVVSRTAS